MYHRFYSLNRYMIMQAVYFLNVAEVPFSQYITLGRQFMRTMLGVKHNNHYVYKILISSTLIGTLVPPGQRMPLPGR